MSKFAWIILLCLTNATWAEGESDKNKAAVEQAEDGRKPAVSAVEEILKRDPKISDYVDKERCINRNRIRQMQVLDEKHVSIQVSRDNFYLVQFKHRCPAYAVVSQSCTKRDQPRCVFTIRFGRWSVGALEGCARVSSVKYLVSKASPRSNWCT